MKNTIKFTISTLFLFAAWGTPASAAVASTAAVSQLLPTLTAMRAARAVQASWEDYIKAKSEADFIAPLLTGREINSLEMSQTIKKAVAYNMLIAKLAEMDTALKITIDNLELLRNGINKDDAAASAMVSGVIDGANLHTENKTVIDKRLKDLAAEYRKMMFLSATLNEHLVLTHKRLQLRHEELVSTLRIMRAKRDSCHVRLISEAMLGHGPFDPGSDTSSMRNIPAPNLLIPYDKD